MSNDGYMRLWASLVSLDFSPRLRGSSYQEPDHFGCAGAWSFIEEIFKPSRLNSATPDMDEYIRCYHEKRSRCCQDH